MTPSYTYNPDTWNPLLAGTVAGAIAAIVAGLASLPLRSPDEVIANTVTIVLVSLLLGLIAGGLWRRLRARDNAERTFAWAMVGGFFVAAAAIALTDLFALGNLVKYAAPLAVIIFVTLGFFVPMLSRVTAPVWVAAIPIVIALAIGFGLFGRGNVASGELSLDDIDTSSTQTTEATVSSDPDAQATTSQPGAVDEPVGLASSYTVESGIATYTADEQLQGLTTQGVGSTESVSGTATPGNAFAFEIDLQSFTSDQPRRDDKVVGWFEEDPIGTFAGDSFDIPATAEVGEVVMLSIPGTMTINGLEEEVEWAVEARLESNGNLSVQGETDIVITDFDIPVVTSSFVQMTDAAHIEVLMTFAPDA